MSSAVGSKGTIRSPMSPLELLRKSKLCSFERDDHVLFFLDHRENVIVPMVENESEVIIGCFQLVIDESDSQFSVAWVFVSSDISSSGWQWQVPFLRILSSLNLANLSSTLYFSEGFPPLL